MKALVCCLPRTISSRSRRCGLLPAGADHVFDFVGLKAVAEQGLEMLGVGGGLYLVGVARPDVAIGVNIVSALRFATSMTATNR
jgi:threonine dehydrogenase-like Zn-dependent dehydrogenase